MNRKAIVAACTLSQWALDYKGNLSRIIESIEVAKAGGARYRCGPELEITGYSCGDHHQESDTQLHAWQVLAKLLDHPSCVDIIIDVGLPVTHKDVLYNCKLVFLNRKILLIRPKMILADDASMGYNETRWFTPWNKPRTLEDHHLPTCITKVTGQRSVPFGDALVVTRDTCIGYEICEELYNPESPHIPEGLDGAEIISNSLGAYEEFQRPQSCYQLITSATMKSGGCYLFANQRGCDGSFGRYSGEAYVSLNGSVISASNPYSLTDVEVAIAEVDLEVVRRYKALIRSRCTHASKSEAYPRVEVDFFLTTDSDPDAPFTPIPPTPPPMRISQPTPEEQILKGPTQWMWNFLKRSGRHGILIILDGGIDSALTAAIVYNMFHLVVRAVTTGEEKVLEDIRKVLRSKDYTPTSARELSGKLLHTLYLHRGEALTEKRKLAALLAKDIGSRHRDVDLTKPLEAMTSLIPSSDVTLSDVTVESLLSRLMMSYAFLYAQSTRTTSQDPDDPRGDLFVVTSADLDHLSTGSWAKYGHTAGDINLLGRFPRDSVKEAVKLALESLPLPTLGPILALYEATIPKDAADLALCHSLQYGEGCGPYSLFGKLMYVWKDRFSPEEVAERVKKFFKNYSLTQLRQLALCPTYYVPGTGPLQDARPAAMSPYWSWQFSAIDQAVHSLQGKEKVEKEKK